jgi:hypothetical protein
VPLILLHFTRLIPFSWAGLTLGGLSLSCLTSRALPKTQSLYFVVTVLYVQFALTTFRSLGVDVSRVYSYPPAQYSVVLGPRVHAAVRGLALEPVVQQLHLSSSYGLFRRMTGMGRPEAGVGQRGTGGMPPSVVAR